MKPFLFALMTVLAPAVFADEAHHKKDALALVEGEVRRVDKAAKKITLRHGPMPALDMPAHTMVFQVRDPAMLDQVKPGDKVKFEAQKIGGAFTLIQIEVAQ